MSMLLTGLFLGIAARLFDICFQNLGEIFSQMMIWILLVTLIAICSPAKKAAMENIFSFCIGMLITYYVIAAITHGDYSRSFIIGRTGLALIFTVGTLCINDEGMRRFFEKHCRRNCDRVGHGSIVIFDHLRIYDFIIDGTLIYLLFFRKIK